MNESNSRDSLKKAIESADSARVAELIAEMDLNTEIGDGLTALLWAVFLNNVEIVRLLLERGASLHVGPKGSRFSPLHAAARHGFVDIARLLIEKGADVHFTEDVGLTPLHEACARGSTPVAELLITEGHADVEACTNDGSTPLHLAAHEGRTAVARMLLERANASTEVTGGPDGYTALYYAAQQGNDGIVKLLLDHGADPRVRTRRGHTPEQIAAQKLHIASALLVCNAGGSWPIMLRALCLGLLLRIAVLIGIYCICQAVVLKTFGAGMAATVVNAGYFALVFIYVLRLIWKNIRKK